ncbi:NAD(P)/FAD-dependent oxidoreductase [Puteibacter caeruleilacunae]|nr:NAD(P)/FAD-dependent oxidoreductase [Puteibacter caeruleilacunae]
MAITKYNTVIVGGGIAGLTSSVYLARAGRKTILIEKNDEFGGLVSSFKRDGFHFEAGVRALESAGVILPMLEDLGIQLEVVRSKVSVGIEDSIVSIEDLSSIENYRDMLVGLYPDSEADISRFIKEMHKIMKHLDVLYGIENPVFKDLKKDINYLFRRLLPWLPKFLLTVGKINRLNKPVESYLETVIASPSLRDIISQHFFKGTPTFFALSYFSLYLDYFYPKGGVDRLVEVLVSKIKEFKGELKPNTTVVEVNASEQYVVDDDGQKYAYDHLIWAADLKAFYEQTLIENLATNIQKNFIANMQRVMAGRSSESVFSLYLEVDLPLSYFDDIANGHFFYTPSKQGLNNIHRGELQSMLCSWTDTDKAKVFSWLDRFLKLNTFEISIPGLKDERLVPPNKTGLIVSFIVDYELFKKVKERGWYNEFRSETESKMIDILTNSVYPKLKIHIEKQFSFTPISIQSRIGSSDGAIVGWSFENEIPVVNKIQYSDKSVLTPIPNIFQAGQWAYSPSGVPMSILTGKLAADRVCKLQK